MLNKLNTDTLAMLEKKNFTELTPIQKNVIPMILERNNTVINSPTGTGKTLAFVIPILNMVDSNIDNLQSLIIAPTKELVSQITDVVREWTTSNNIRVLPIIGGANLKRQLDKLKEKPHIIVATPSRFFELIQLKKIKVHKVKTIVVDEIDEIIKQKSTDVVSNIIKSCQSDTQIIFSSATTNDATNNLMSSFRQDYKVCKVNEEINNNIEYYFIVINHQERKDIIRKLSYHLEGQTLAFSNDNYLLKTMDEIVLKSKDVSVINSNTSKEQRTSRIREFRNGKLKTLISSDLTSRGIDIANLVNVIHLDLPDNNSQFKHRNGRVGRMGRQGNVIFVITKDKVQELKLLATKHKVIEKLKELKVNNGIFELK